MAGALALAECAETTSATNVETVSNTDSTTAHTIADTDAAAEAFLSTLSEKQQ